jgi:TolA-binding protein
MNIRCLPFRPFSVLVPVITLCSFLLLPGCGSSKKAQEEEMIRETLRLQYKVDSLVAENNRLVRQVEALAMENRSMAARTGELEMKLREQESAPPQPPVMDMSSSYDDALAKYRRRDFAGAMAGFEGLLKRGVRDDLADNCHYWIGECLYGLGNYRDAISHFETVMGFASSDKKDDSSLMIGNSHAAMGNTSAAADAYNRLISSYPASPYVAKAKEKLARLGR